MLSGILRQVQLERLGNLEPVQAVDHVEVVVQQAVDDHRLLDAVLADADRQAVELSSLASGGSQSA